MDISSPKTCPLKIKETFEENSLPKYSISVPKLQKIQFLMKVPKLLNISTLALFSKSKDLIKNTPNYLQISPNISVFWKKPTDKHKIFTKQSMTVLTNFRQIAPNFKANLI